MSKLVKQMELDALTGTLQGVRDMVLLAPGKVSAQIEYNFRKSLREKKIRVQLVKNTLARRVMEAQGIRLDGVWSGPTLVAWGGDSIKELSRAVDNLLKTLVNADVKAGPKMQVKTAVADGQQVTFEQAKNMPTRLEAIGEVLGMVLGVASAIAGCLTGPAGQVASQIATIAERKPEEGAAPEPVARGTGE